MLLAAFESHTVFGSADDGIACFSCASCDLEFRWRIWAPKPDAQNRPAHEVQSVVDVRSSNFSERDTVAPPVAAISPDGSTPSVVAERLLIASIRHHCSTAIHKATLRKLWPDRHRARSPDADLALDSTGKSRNYVVIEINGVRTLVSRHVGGSAIFEPEQDDGVEADNDVGVHGNERSSAWLHLAATAFSHSAIALDVNLVPQINERGTRQRRLAGADMEVARLMRAGKSSDAQLHAYNVNGASYRAAAACHRSIGRVALIEQHAASRPPTVVKNRRGAHVVLPGRAEVTVRAVEIPVGGRDDTAADFAEVVDGQAYRLVRAREEAIKEAQQLRLLGKARDEGEGAGGDIAHVDHLEAFVSEQAAFHLELADRHHDFVE